MTLNFQRIVKRYPNPNDVVGSSNPNLKIFSLLDEKLARCGHAPPMFQEEGKVGT